MSAPLSVDTGPAAPPPLDPRTRRARRVATCATALLVALALAAAWLLWDNRRLAVTDYEVGVHSELGPDGLRIVQVSDLHAADFGDFRDRLIDATQQAQPDLIAITGDMIDIRTRNLDPALETAAQLAAIAPIYFVLGNHEADSPLREELLVGLEAAGVTVLRNQAEVISAGGAEAVLVGIDDPRVDTADGRSVSSAQNDAALALADLDPQPQEDLPVVLLAHRPERLDDYAEIPADVVLSGHAHGGQVRLPFIGGLYAPHQGWYPELTSGTHTREGTTMVISRGLGNSVVAVRVNNPRELVVLDISGT